MVTLNRFEVELIVDTEGKSKFCKARPVPYALNEWVEKKLERLVKDDNILNGQPQSCLYWQMTTLWEFNQASLCDKYPVLKRETYLLL